MATAGASGRPVGNVHGHVPTTPPNNVAKERVGHTMDSHPFPTPHPVPGQHSGWRYLRFVDAERDRLADRPRDGERLGEAARAARTATATDNETADTEITLSSREHVCQKGSPRRHTEKAHLKKPKQPPPRLGAQTQTQANMASAAAARARHGNAPNAPPPLPSRRRGPLLAGIAPAFFEPDRPREAEETLSRSRTESGDTTPATGDAVAAAAAGAPGCASELLSSLLPPEFTNTQVDSMTRKRTSQVKLTARGIAFAARAARAADGKRPNDSRAQRSEGHAQ
jgi:hypothetical protein